MKGSVEWHKHTCFEGWPKNCDHRALISIHFLQAACDPECLLAQQRLAATALGLPVALHAATPAVYDEASFARLEAVAFDNSTLHGVELGQVRVRLCVCFA